MNEDNFYDYEPDDEWAKPEYLDWMYEESDHANAWDDLRDALSDGDFDEDHF